MPHPSVDATNVIYLEYTALREDTDDGLTHKFRNGYAKKSTDGGMNWTSDEDAFNVYNDDFSEITYPATARFADIYLHVSFSWDDVVGNLANASPANYNPNLYIKYEQVDVNDIPDAVVGVTEINKASFSVGVYPNPANDVAYLTYSLSKASTIEIEVLNVTGQVVSSTSKSLNAGGTIVHMPVADLPGGVYFINSRINGEQILTNKLVKE
jgi:hypothetical protein